MAKGKAVYAGTFDPPTAGHLWMIERGAEIFDELIVAIGVNPEKNCLFTVEERSEMLQKATSHLPNVRVTCFVNMFLVKYAEELGAKFILRGIRSVADYEYEKAMRHLNSDLNPKIHTIFLEPPREMSEVSSSMVKGMVGPDKWEEVVEKYVDPFVFSKFQTIHLKKVLRERWQELWIRLGAFGDSLKYFDRLVQAYTEPHRIYHNLAHIAHCLREFDSAKHLANNRTVTELAIWYHDFYSDPLSLDNVARSAVEVGKFCREVGRELFDGEAIDLVMATDHVDNKPVSDDAKLLVDIDLAILGQPQKVFDRYEEDIRKEYSFIDEKIFREGRAKVLRTFLEPKRQHIYYTDFFREKYEHKATANIFGSIQRLEDNRFAP